MNEEQGGYCGASEILQSLRRVGALVRIVVHWMCMRRWPTPEEARWN